MAPEGERVVEQNFLAWAMGEEEEVEEQYFPVEKVVEAVDLNYLSKAQQQELRTCVPEGVFSLARRTWLKIALS